MTAAELAAMYDCDRSPNVLRLLKEIHRLRSTIMRADQIRKMIGPAGHSCVAGTVWQCFERELDAEPCLTDPPTPRQKRVTDDIVRGLEESRRNRRKG